MALSTKQENWVAPATDEAFVHPVKRLCLRSTTPKAEKADSIFHSQDDTCPCPIDLNIAQEEPPCSPSPSSLDCLGEDLLLQVLRLAQPTAWDLCRMATVSRTWRDACYNRIFWTKLRVGSGSMRPGVEQLASRCNHLMELHIDDPRCELYVLHPIVVAAGPSLRRVAINCDMDASTRNEASICSILWIISLYCKNVDTVELLSDGQRGGFGYLESKALWYLTSGFRNMRSFASLCQESITKQSLYLMVIAWRDLACLRIHCGMLGKDDLVSLRKCHALRVLELVGGQLGAIVGDVVAEQRNSKEFIIHSKMEVVVLSDIVCEPQDLVSLTLLCPGLKRILLSKGSWAYGESVLHMARMRSQFKLLQTWLHVAKGIELLIED